MKNLKNKHVICIVAAIICIMGSLIEYICTKEPPYLVNLLMSISVFTIIIFCLICKPAGDWLEKHVLNQNHIIRIHCLENQQKNR